jgi:hypothetical protein
VQAQDNIAGTALCLVTGSALGGMIDFSLVLLEIEARKGAGLFRCAQQ